MPVTYTRDGDHPDRRDHAGGAALSCCVAPLVGEHGVRHPVEPALGAVQRVLYGVLLAAHPDPLHQPPRRHVVGEAERLDPAQAEVLEADAQQLGGRLGGQPPAGVRRVDRPADLGLHALGLVRDVALRPGVGDVEVEVAHGPPVELEHQRAGQRAGCRHLLVEPLEAREVVADPLPHRRDPPVLPQRLHVGGDHRPDRQAGAAHRPVDGAEVLGRWRLGRGVLRHAFSVVPGDRRRRGVFAPTRSATGRAASLRCSISRPWMFAEPADG